MYILIYTLQYLTDILRSKPRCQNPRYQNPRCLKPMVNLTCVLRASPTCLSLLIMQCSKAFNGGFFFLLSFPRSLFLVDMSSSISSFNDLLPFTLIHLFLSFDHFDPIKVILSSVQFTFCIFFLDLHLLS
jgi:hypothetical protein